MTTSREDRHEVLATQAVDGIMGLGPNTRRWFKDLALAALEASPSPDCEPRALSDAIWLGKEAIARDAPFVDMIIRRHSADSPSI